MKTIILDEPGKFRFTQTDPPMAPGAGEALIKIKHVGICGTDLHAFRGRQPFFSYPRILGHELGVEVVELGPDALAADGTALKPDDVCAVEPYLNCGTCISCRRGKTNCCTSLQVLGVHTDGGMRELITVPAHKLHKVQSNAIGTDKLAMVEMLCIGAHAARRGQPEKDEQVLVIGAGPIGLGAIQFNRILGADVTVMEMSDKRMEFCQQNIGIEKFIDAKGDVEAQLQSMMGDDRPTLVYDATGNVHSMNKSFEYVAHGGKLVFVGLVQADISFNDPYFHSHEITLMSSRNATSDDFAWVVENIEAGNLTLDPWITHRSTPENLIDDFPGWLDPESGVVKAMLEF
ncbi:MAG: zinc-binding alcohol dehydrogenase family protein [Chloroflexota bacterium]